MEHPSNVFQLIERQGSEWGVISINRGGGADYSYRGKSYDVDPYGKKAGRKLDSGTAHSEKENLYPKSVPLTIGR